MWANRAGAAPGSAGILFDRRFKRDVGVLHHVDVLFAVVSFQPALADADQADVVPEDVGDYRVGRLGDQYLVADRAAAELGAAVDCRRAVVAILGVGFSGENCHADADRDLVCPRFRHERLLSGQGR